MISITPVCFAESSDRQVVRTSSFTSCIVPSAETWNYSKWLSTLAIFRHCLLTACGKTCRWPRVRLHGDPDFHRLLFWSSPRSYGLAPTSKKCPKSKHMLVLLQLYHPNPLEYFRSDLDWFGVLFGTVWCNMLMTLPNSLHMVWKCTGSTVLVSN